MYLQLAFSLQSACRPSVCFWARKKSPVLCYDAYVYNLRFFFLPDSISKNHSTEVTISNSIHRSCGSLLELLTKGSTSMTQYMDVLRLYWKINFMMIFSQLFDCYTTIQPAWLCPLREVWNQSDHKLPQFLPTIESVWNSMNATYLGTIFHIYVSKIHETFYAKGLDEVVRY